MLGNSVQILNNCCKVLSIKKIEKKLFQENLKFLFNEIILFNPKMILKFSKSQQEFSLYLFQGNINNLTFRVNVI